MDSFSFTSVQGTTEIFYCSEPFLPAADGNAVYVADTNTVNIIRQARNFNASLPLAVIEAGERSKQLASVKRILQKALSANLTRKGVFIGVGGGVVCDLTAFAASIYMRGACCKLVPTSLLAMADAAIGGKTAVNFHNYKNMLGTFFKAESIYIAPTVLSSLSEKEYFSGLAEVLKTAFLYSPKLYELLQTGKVQIIKREPALLLKIIKMAAEAKAKTVSADFYEEGARSFLNLGHTFGHALEAVSGFSVPHGHAVAWGIAQALRFGEHAGFTKASYAESVRTILKGYGYAVEPYFMENNTKDAGMKQAAFNCLTKKDFVTKLIRAMKADKKNNNDKIKLILQEDLAKTFIYSASQADIKELFL